MSKGAQKRINETIAYVVANVPANERANVKTYMEGKIRQFAPTGEVKGLSDPMSMNDLATRGTADERHKRRSLILIELMGGVQVGMTAKTMGTAKVDTTFTESIRSIRWVVDQNAGTGQVIQEPLDELKTNPLAFLQTYPLMVFGSETDGSMQQYFVYERPTMTDVPHKFGFYSASMHKHFNHSPFQPVANVPGVVWSDVPNRGKNHTAGSFATIDGTDLGTETLMLTTQFSGCSFCVKTHGGSTYAAHIMPGAEHIANSDLTGGGKALAEQLAGQKPPVVGGDFGPPAPAGGQFYVFGRGYSNTAIGAGYSAGGSMTLVGVKRLGTWEFFSQEVSNGRVTSAVKVL